MVDLGELIELIDEGDETHLRAFAHSLIRGSLLMEKG